MHPACRQRAPELRAAAAAELLAELLDLSGCVLVIEDAQWLDDVFVRVVELLAPTIHVLTTVRSDGDALPAALESRTGQATLHRLGPLDPDDIDALVRDELGLPSLPEGLLEWLRERGGGTRASPSSCSRCLGRLPEDPELAAIEAKFTGGTTKSRADCRSFDPIVELRIPVDEHAEPVGDAGPIDDGPVVARV